MSPEGPGPDAQATPEDAPQRQRKEPDLSKEVPAILAMALLFLVSIGLALVVAPTYLQQNVQAFEDPQSLTNPLYYLGIVVVFTLAILAIAKWGRGWIIQVIFLGAVFATLIYVTFPLLNLQLPPDTANLTALGLSAVLVGLLYFYPEWYVIDTVGVAVAGGAAAIFGISFGLLPSLLLLVAFAVYDAIAVYRTKHMLDLADNVLTLRLPIMLVVPKTRGYSFLAETRRFREAADEAEGPASSTEAPAGGEDADEDEDTVEEAEAEAEEAGAEAEGPSDTPAKTGLDPGTKPDAMFMGLGDIVIPGVLVVSSFTFLQGYNASVASVLGLAPHLAVALATLLGAMVGFAVLMALVLTGKPQAGLPTLNGGAILFFLLALLPLYGVDPLVAPLPF